MLCSPWGAKSYSKCASGYVRNTCPTCGPHAEGLGEPAEFADQHLLQQASLVHRCRCNHTTVVGHRLEPGSFSGCKLLSHLRSLLEVVVEVCAAETDAHYIEPRCGVSIDYK